MNAITMLLGLAPIPARHPDAKGSTHMADGRAPRKQVERPDRKDHIKERIDSILLMCKCEPCTFRELAEALNIKDGTLSADLRKMVQEGTLRSRLHRQETIYWVPA